MNKTHLFASNAGYQGVPAHQRPRPRQQLVMAKLSHWCQNQVLQELQDLGLGRNNEFGFRVNVDFTHLLLRPLAPSRPHLRRRRLHLHLPRRHRLLRILLLHLRILHLRRRCPAAA